MFVDEDKNGFWTTGNLEKRIQPEPSFQYTAPILIRANWDFEINWSPE
jgi:hypothetical protein